MPRGKKSCPKCHASVGPRLRVCECGYEFAFKAKPDPPRPLPPTIPPKVAPTETPADTSGVTAVTITDRGKLGSFIKDLKSCYERSDYNGGGYATYLHHKHGTLRVDVCLMMRLPKESKR